MIFTQPHSKFASHPDHHVCQTSVQREARFEIVYNMRTGYFIHFHCFPEVLSSNHIVTVMRFSTEPQGTSDLTVRFHLFSQYERPKEPRERQSNYYPSENPECQILTYFNLFAEQICKDAILQSCQRSSYGFSI